MVSNLRRPGLKIFPHCGKNSLIRAVAGQFEADAANADFNACGDLEQAQTHGADGGLFQGSAPQRTSLQKREHQVGKGAQPEPQLIGGHIMGARPIGEQ